MIFYFLPFSVIPRAYFYVAVDVGCVAVVILYLCPGARRVCNIAETERVFSYYFEKELTALTI